MGQKERLEGATRENPLLFESWNPGKLPFFVQAEMVVIPGDTVGPPS